MFNFPWSPHNHGLEVSIDDYSDFPKETIAAVDIETNGVEESDPKFKIVCVGICGDGKKARVYFDIRPELISYLRKLQIVAHAGGRAEIPWLIKSYGDFSIEQLYFDTKTAYYVYDSARRKYGLKDILKEVFGVSYPTYKEITTDKEIIASLYKNKEQKKLPKFVSLEAMPKEIVAQYNAMDCVYTYRLWTWLRQRFTARHWAFFNNIEMPETRLIYRMEKEGIGVNLVTVRSIHKQHSMDRRKALQSFKALGGVGINPKSPKQILSLLRDGGIAVDSTSEDALSNHKDNPLVGALLDYRKHQKICSTYTIPLYFSAAKDSHHRIHTRFSQNTITGRLSSGDPINLQNQPQETRECFEAKPGHVFINADWSNIELRLPAHFSQEPGFINELSRPGGDLHQLTADFIHRNRRTAKTVNFLLTNSGTARRMSVELGCDEEEANEIYRLFWEGYPTLAAWLEREKQIAQTRGGISSWFGRWVSIPEIKAPKQNVVEEAKRTAISVLVQGTASDLNKLAKLNIYKQYKMVPVVNVHDEIMYEVPEEGSWVVAGWIKRHMENVVHLRVPLVAEVGIGRTWKEAKSSCSYPQDCGDAECMRHSKTRLVKAAA